MTLIPKILHTIWIGPRPVPWRLIQTWRDHHPAWEHRLWWSDKLQAYLTTSPHPPSATFARPWLNGPAIAHVRELNGKADVMRYEILARHGGVYVDADMECLHPLTDDFLTHEAWASWEHETERPGLVATTVMGGRPRASLFNTLVLGLSDVPQSRRLHGPAWETVGPLYLTSIVKSHPEVFLYPSRTFLPVHASGAPAPGNSPIYGRHHWGGTTPGVYADEEEGSDEDRLRGGRPLRGG